MKRYLITLCVILLLTSPVSAQVDVLEMAASDGGGASAPARFCSSCTTADADGLCEDFESGDCTLTDVDGGASCTLSRSNDIVAGIGCSETTNTKSAEYITGNVPCHSYFDMGSAKSTFYFYGHFNITAHSIASGGAKILISASESTNFNINKCFRFLTENVSGTMTTESTHLGSSGDEANTNTTDNLFDTWIPFRFTWISGTLYKLELDWNNDGTFTTFVEDTSPGTRSCRYIGFGGSVAGLAGTMTIEYDNLKIDYTAMPEGCTR